MTQLGSTLEQLKNNQDFVNLRTLEGVRVDLRYGRTDNFMGKNVYGQFTEPFLHREAALKLQEAIKTLRKTHPAWSLLVFDALRPRAVQRLLWAHVAGTPEEQYVANPDRGSMHNYGCAIDLSLADENGREVEMGTGFDSFIPLSQPKLEEENLRTGLLQRKHFENRLILRGAMTGAGFLQLSHEWWHYDAFPSAEVRQRFQLIE